MEDEKEKGTEEQETQVEEQKTQVDEQTPTAEEQLEKTRQELEDIRRLASEKEAGFKTLQRQLNETQQELRKRGEYDSRLNELGDRLELLATAVATASPVDEDLEGVSPKARKDILAQLKEIQREQEAKRLEARRQAERDEYNQKANDIWAKAQALGLPDDNDELLDIEEFLSDGKLKKAEVRLKKLEQVKKKESSEGGPPKESDEERIKKAAEQLLREKGLLTQDIGKPSGAADADAEYLEKFGRGEVHDAKRAKEIMDKRNKGV